VNDYKNNQREAKRICRKKDGFYEVDILESVEEAKRRNEV
jgi:hypothetical protein